MFEYATVINLSNEEECKTNNLNEMCLAKRDAEERIDKDVRSASEEMKMDEERFDSNLEELIVVG